MAIDDIDVSEWDQRTQEIVRKHGLKTYRYESWKRVCEGDMGYVELTYLRHIGQKVYLDSLDQRNPNSSCYDVQLAIETSKEARRIFLLFEELDISPNHSRRGYVKHLLNFLDVYLTYIVVSKEE